MYILSVNQRKALDKFISSIPESTVKGGYEKWNERVISHDERVTSYDTDEFVAMSHNLNADLQHFPQEFVNNIKNYIDFGKIIPTAEVDKAEVAIETKKNMAITKKVVEPVPVKVVKKEVVVVSKKKAAVVPVKVVTKKK